MDIDKFATSAAKGITVAAFLSLITNVALGCGLVVSWTSGLIF